MFIMHIYNGITVHMTENLQHRMVIYRNISWITCYRIYSTNLIKHIFDVVLLWK